MSWDFFPEELKALPQWLVAGVGGPQSDDYKRPINPKTNTWASITDPNTWGTFEQAMASTWPLKGFVFSDKDPYTVIDLDTYKAKDLRVKDLHAAIAGDLNTYQELSQSGLGTHIIGRGSIPLGVHNDEFCIEIYSTGRFMICTGNVAGVSYPIIDIQEYLDQLYPKVKKAITTGDWRTLGDGEESDISDADLVERIMNAENADKFLRLCQGDLSMHDNDHSRADEALIQFFCYYTQDNRQVERLFHYSELAKRDKAQRPDYVPRTISYSRKMIEKDTPPPVDVSVIVERAKQAAMAPEVETLLLEKTGPVPLHTTSALFPPGLVGEIAQFVMQASSRPVPEIALAAALAVTAGVAGRQYNCSTPGTGLNQYLLLLAATGVGKEAAQQCIDILFAAVQKTTPAAGGFLGPARFASGQALVKQFQKQPCFVSVLGEFGDRLKELTTSRNEHASGFMGAMKDIYNKSGWDQVLRASVHSDKEKNSAEVRAPALTLLAETAPEAFFEALDESLIAGGLLPRFLVIEYAGDRVSRIEGISTPSASLVKKLSDLCSVVLQMQQNNTCAGVGMTNEAAAVMDAYDRATDDRIRGATEVYRQLWNRAHFKALRLASLVAVGLDAYHPMVTENVAQWAVDFVEKGIVVLASRFAKGDVGEGDSKLRSDLIGVIQKYMSDGAPKYADYHARGCIPLQYLTRQTSGRAAFRKHKLGSNRALKDSLDAMLMSGEIVLVDKKTASEWFKTTSTVYALGDQWNKQ